MKELAVKVGSVVIASIIVLALNGLVWWFCYGFVALAFGWPHLNYLESLCVIVLFSIFWSVWKFHSGKNKTI